VTNENLKKIKNDLNSLTLCFYREKYLKKIGGKFEFADKTSPLKNCFSLVKRLICLQFLSIGFDEKGRDF